MTTPTTSSQAAPEIVDVIERYVAALNKRDLEGVRAAFNFPHVLFGTGMVTHYPTRDDVSFTAFDSRTAQHGWARSTWDSHCVLASDPEKVHVDVWFTRWRADGSKIGTHHSMYIITKVDGRWGIQARSSYG